MGTRASFFVGDPQDLAGREWLGCIAWDGYPEGDVRILAKATTEAVFRESVAVLTAGRRDFCDPAKHGFPFPWADNLFLTDYTYAWMGEKVMMTSFHTGWVEMAKYLGSKRAAQAYGRRKDRLPKTVPAPAKWDPSAPDSIIILTSRGTWP